MSVDKADCIIQSSRDRVMRRSVEEIESRMTESGVSKAIDLHLLTKQICDVISSHDREMKRRAESIDQYSIYRQ